MQEIFKNVRKEVKDVATTAWDLALAQINPSAAAEFLDNVTNYYKNIFTEEEIEFLQFYFRMKMEVIDE